VNEKYRRLIEVELSPFTTQDNHVCFVVTVV